MNEERQLPVPVNPFGPEAERRVQAITTAGHYADQVAAKHVFDDYLRRKAKRTQMSYLDDLDTWARYITAILKAKEQMGADDDLAGVDYLVPYAWTGTTFGLVEAYKRWLLDDGYAIASVNRKLTTVRSFCKLAWKAGILTDSEHLSISTVTGYSQKEAIHIDNERRSQNVDTRKSSKKAQPVKITTAQARMLKRDHPDTPQGQRDAVIMCLLLDHGLRVGEIEILEVANVNTVEGTLRFYRPKVNKWQTHELTTDTLKAMIKWLKTSNIAIGPLLQSTHRYGDLAQPGITTRSIADKVRELGENLDIHGLSPHDCRHYWATDAVKSGTSLTDLRDAGGWNSLAMPSHYVAAADIANQGVKQSK